MIGILLGKYHEHLGLIGKSFDNISNIDPHLMLTIFIPPLIFESSFSMSYHIFMKEILSISLLAGPGVLLQAYLVAILVT